MSRKSRLMILAATALCIAVAAFAATTLTVQVQNTRLRATPKFWGTTVATIPVGTKVTESKREGEWIYGTTATGLKGWVHVSAVTTKNVQLTSGGSTAGSKTSTKEVSMAGKGFNTEVEAEYAKGKTVDFAAVNEMAKITVPDEELEAFLKSGKLAEWGVKK